MRRLPFCLLAAAACFILVACTAQVPEPELPERPEVSSERMQFEDVHEGDLVAEIETSEGTIRAVLYRDIAPLAVRAFELLSGEGLYDGTLFHRVVEGFLIQGGDIEGDGSVGSAPWYGGRLGAEPSDELHHYSGALCLAADGSGALGSQFYILATPPGLSATALENLRGAGWLPEGVADAYAAAGGAPWLDNTDTVFGQVFEGMEVVDRIAAMGGKDRKGDPVEVVSIRVGPWQPEAEEE